MAYEFPEAIAPYCEREFLYSLGILANLGIVQIDRSGSLIGSGNFMDIPQIDETSDPQRRDIGTTGQVRTFQEGGTSIQRGVVLHDDIADKFPRGNAVFSGADFQTNWLKRAGLKMARRCKQSLYRVAKAAIEQVDSPTANCHISDVYHATTQAPMTVLRLHTARQLLGDASGLLSVCVMHSDCWADLFRDNIGTYQVDNVAGRLINSGGITDIGMQRSIRESVGFRIVTADSLGMTIVIDDDIGVTDMTAATYVYDNKYETLLFGPGAMILSYQRGFTPTLENDINDARGTVLKMRAEIDYVAHLWNVEWNSGTTNPTDTQLGTKSNWSSVYTDHKSVLAVKLITN